MNRLQPILELSKEMEALLIKESKQSDRDILIAEVTKLIAERGKQMDQLTPPFTEEETAVGQALIPLNMVIEEKMQLLFNEIKLDMKQLKQQKRSKQQYKNPYRHVQVMDGMYIDNRN